MKQTVGCSCGTDMFTFNKVMMINTSLTETAKAGMVAGRTLRPQLD